MEAGKVTLEDYVGNNLADIAAGFAAQQGRAPEHFLNEASKKEAEARLIAQRLACIEVWHREHIPTLVPAFAPPANAAQTITPENAAQQTQQEAQASGHDLL